MLLIKIKELLTVIKANKLTKSNVKQLVKASSNSNLPAGYDEAVNSVNHEGYNLLMARWSKQNKLSQEHIILCFGQETANILAM